VLLRAAPKNALPSPPRKQGDGIAAAALKGARALLSALRKQEVMELLPLR